LKQTREKMKQPWDRDETNMGERWDKPGEALVSINYSGCKSAGYVFF
jgi:hypothetical protein